MDAPTLLNDNGLCCQCPIWREPKGGRLLRCPIAFMNTAGSSLCIAGEDALTTAAQALLLRAALVRRARLLAQEQEASRA